jgi:hypothetical protein
MRAAEEVRYLGEFPNTEAATRKLVAKLATKYDKLDSRGGWVPLTS